MRTVRGPSQPGLRRLARQALARAVSAGVAETVALSRARGEAIEAETPGRGPYRRQTGLDWLAGRGRIGDAARTAGERYGQAWRRARMEPSIPSSLDIQPPFSFPFPIDGFPIFREGSSRPPSKPPERDRKQCDLQYASDTDICVGQIDEKSKAVCHESAADRLAHCLRYGEVDIPALKTFPGGRRKWR